MFTFPVTHWAPEEQTLTISGPLSNFVLTSHTPFTDLDKSRKITVTLTGAFASTSHLTPAFDCGDLSTWAAVDITLSSGGTIYGRGGQGGSANSGAGGAGGDGLELNSANSSSILSFDNQGTIGGAGGGGGAGARSGAACYATSGNNCVSQGTNWGGGGGGGSGQGGNTVSGGIRTVSSIAGGCCSVLQASLNGGSGGTGGAGIAGQRGRTNYRGSASGKDGCTGNCTNIVNGTAGAAGGAWVTAGGNSNGAGGAAGTSVLNKASATYTNNGTEH